MDDGYNELFNSKIDEPLNQFSHYICMHLKFSVTQEDPTFLPLIHTYND